MSQERLPMRKIREVLRLKAAAALPASNIAEDATAATGLAKHSSRAYCKRPGVTLLLLWEEYRGRHPDGLGYSRFCEIYQE